jgi:hypothetical protein
VEERITLFHKYLHAEVPALNRGCDHATDNTWGVGFNPHRKMHKRPSDYLMVAGALAAIIAFVLWAFLG